MLTKSILRTVTRRLPRHTRACFYHQSNNKQVEQVESPLNKITQGLSAVTSTILKAPSLRQLTRPRLETLPFTGKANNWDEAIKEAQGVVKSKDNEERIFDPVKIVGKDLWELKGNITKLLGSGHPFIDTIGKHYFESDTNRIRPLLVLLFAKATAGEITDRQRSLAEITEMIYTASLLHDDVMDSQQNSGNKLAVLAGDFLLARASLALAHLRNAECTELMATCIANSVEGVFMQLQELEHASLLDKAFDYYLEQVYMKTGSLIAQSCKASTVLAGCTTETTKMTYDYGKHLGIAFQLISDVRHFSKIVAQSKHTTPEAWINAPILLAWKECPQLGPIIQRKFNQEGDMEKTRFLVYQSNALKKTLELVDQHVAKAIQSIDKLPNSEAKSALVQLAINLPSKQD